jgi:hypothetical protein
LKTDEALTDQCAYDDLAGRLAAAKENPGHSQGNPFIKRELFTALLYRPAAEKASGLEMIAGVLGEGLEKIKNEYQAFKVENKR